MNRIPGKGSLPAKRARHTVISDGTPKLRSQVLMAPQVHVARIEGTKPTTVTAAVPPAIELACARLARLRDFDLHWVEEPVRADDLAGHARVRATAGVNVQTGENWWYPADCAKAIAAGASDFAMLDVMKTGGISGWVRAAALADAANLPVSSHTFIEASAHALAATPNVHWLEYLDKAGPILREPLQVVAGTITPTGPGLGMTWDEKAVARYAA